MRRVIIIQARMSSARLPGKVLSEISGKPMLAQQISRLKLCREADEVVLATSINAIDDPIVELAKKESISYFRGDENDVLSRFLGTAKQERADIIVRVTADCPLVDPHITDKIIRELAENAQQCDYVSNVIKRTYPRGLDVEAFFYDTLLRMDRLARSKNSREHVTVFLRSEQPNLFICRSVEDVVDNSDLRWTVDTSEDLEFIKILFNKLGPSILTSTYQEILTYVRSHPELIRIDSKAATWDPCR